MSEYMLRNIHNELIMTRRCIQDMQDAISKVGEIDYEVKEIREMLESFQEGKEDKH